MKEIPSMVCLIQYLATPYSSVLYTHSEQFIAADDSEQPDGRHQGHARLFHMLSQAEDIDSEVVPPAQNCATMTDATEHVVDLIGGPSLSAGIWEMRCRVRCQLCVVIIMYTEHLFSFL